MRLKIAANREHLHTVGTVAAIVLSAYALRLLGRLEIAATLTGYIRSLLYIGLYTAWGISVHQRIIQPQLRRYLLAIAFLTVFWMSVRTVKYYIATDGELLRLLWYMFYIPMLLIPLFSLFTALSLGKPESYRLPKPIRLLYFPTLVLLLLVLTNDYHEWVFSFPADLPRTDSHYGYAPGYWLVIGYIAACALTAMAVMLHRCRLPQSKRLRRLPLVPLLFILIYSFLYIIGIPLLRVLLGDMTAFFCLAITVTLEACICCRLIPSNTGYAELFEISGIRAQITDRQFHVLYSSAAAPVLSEAAMCQAAAGCIHLDQKTLFRGHPIHAGFVFWQEDVSELLAVLEKLQLTQTELRDTGNLLKAETEQKKRWLRIREENRLYDMEQQTAPQVALLNELLSQLRRAADLATARQLLRRIVLLETYIKRRNNLIFVAGQKASVEVGELRLCLNESAASLRLNGIQCSAVLELTKPLSPEHAYAIYDFLEAVTEKSIATLSSLLLFAQEEAKSLQVRVCAACAENLSILCERFAQVEVLRDTDGLWYLTLTLEKGGAA